MQHGVSPAKRAAFGSKRRTLADVVRCVVSEWDNRRDSRMEAIGAALGLAVGFVILWAGMTWTRATIRAAVDDSFAWHAAVRARAGRIARLRAWRAVRSRLRGMAGILARA